MKVSMSPKYEPLNLLILGIIFLIIGLLFGTRLQPVWLDEVMLTEPASNLYLYGEFNSSAWYHQPDDVFHVSTSLLYTASLALWMKIVGFSLLKVRLFNYLLMIISSAFLWLAVKRLNLITSPWLRVILIASFLMVGGINFVYEAGRYDVVCILLSLIGFFAFSIENRKKRLLIIAFIGFLLPLAGLSSLIFSILFLSILLIFNYSLVWREFIVIIIGAFCGLLFLYWLYSSNGVWNDFVSVSMGHSTIAQSSDQNNFIDIAISKTKKLFDKNDYICGGCLANDSSWPALSILTLIIFFYELLTRTLQLRSSSVLGLTVAILIPLSMCLLGKYPIYYSWMSVLPMLVCIFSSIDKLERSKSFHGFKKIIIYSIFGIFILKANYSGLPSAILLSSQQWDFRDYAKVRNFIDTNIKDNDVVYADSQAFYAIKEKVKKVYFPPYYGQMKDDDINKLSAIIIDPREESRAPWNPGLSEIVKNRASQWYETGAIIRHKSLYVKVISKKLY